MAFELRSMNFSISQLLESDKFILIEQVEKRKYADGKPTDELYTVAVVTTPQSGFEKISVKLDCKPLPISNNEIKEKNSNLDFVWVKFSGDKAKFYTDFKSGTQKVSARAETINFCDDLEVEIDL